MGKDPVRAVARPAGTYRPGQPAPPSARCPTARTGSPFRPPDGMIPAAGSWKSAGHNATLTLGMRLRAVSDQKVGWPRLAAVGRNGQGADDSCRGVWVTRELRAGELGKAVGGPMWDERALLPVLTVGNGPLRGASFRLTRGLRIIGRDADVDVLLDDVKVSRRHATLTVGDGPTLLADAGSTNGTWLNDHRVSEPRELRDGDRVRIGQVELRFFDPAMATTVPVALRYLPPSGLPASGLPSPGRPGAGAPVARTEALTAPTVVAEAVDPADDGVPPVTVAPADPAPAGRMLLTMVGLLAAAATLAWAYLTLA